MGIFSETVPITAVTTYIDRLTSRDTDDEDLSGIVQLSEAVNLTVTGPREASRTLRKKLKYSTPHEQVRALVILQALIENAGSHFLQNFSDEKLEDRMLQCATNSEYSKPVRKRAIHMIKLWHNDYSNVRGMESMSSLVSRLPQRQSSASHSEQPTINLKKVGPILERLIASSSMAATNLSNSLVRINPNTENPAKNKQIMVYYVDCKRAHRSLLRYIQAIQDEMWLANLLKANDEIVTAIDAFKEKCSENSDYSSDSGSYSSSYSRHLDDRASYISRSSSGGSNAQRSEDLDVNNPFGDHNRLE
ncbi:Protein lsb5 [Schizosaccharomyces pombe]|uniref:Protein lsb5 n=1 Tax=Schizosaccharomyces pombe (strain 972 / ATCC 24843) TaxID=284812 RepID=LSB5_SCHPO|nr:putative protein lsb5 [Schizosaccharomyces pombe]P87308.1 RecName: Full=Protein lsb5 [Schizosaccharomyces pombe 972h-]CAB10084.1 cortical component Lsb5 (predicted) [Schizosaccharomyces pombe]|eukprot:NP_596569.1 putative protein lsb5 [Schizosaccharomyces pombe]